jgi:hypothetical protein
MVRIQYSRDICYDRPVDRGITPIYQCWSVCSYFLTNPNACKLVLLSANHREDGNPREYTYPRAPIKSS